MNRLGVARGRQIKSFHTEGQGADTHASVNKKKTKQHVNAFTPCKLEFSGWGYRLSVTSSLPSWTQRASGLLEWRTREWRFPRKQSQDGEHTVNMRIKKVWLWNLWTQVLTRTFSEAVASFDPLASKASAANGLSWAGIILAALWKTEASTFYAWTIPKGFSSSQQL